MKAWMDDYTRAVRAHPRPAAIHRIVTNAG